MDNLAEVVKQAVFEEYGGGGHNLKTFRVSSDDGQAFAVLIADTAVHKGDADIIVFARIQDDYVIIEADSTDYPLEEVLVVMGIPREKIICAHRGESLEDKAAAS
jgi:XisI protein